MPILTDLDKFRLELGDIDATAPLFNDDEAGYFIAARPGSVLLAVADACESLARRFAREFDFDAPNEKSFKRSQKAEAYRKMAAELRDRAKIEDGGGLTVLTMTRVDGYSDDLSTRDGAGQVAVTGRARHGYYDPDEPIPS